mmetsp:Transcript_28604/g.90209  ORF Transcript_28604/g.90209 Transcript_28604/m.90209 type:complete len:88 (+) Transcript_28604:88-351(+)
MAADEALHLAKSIAWAVEVLRENIPEAEIPPSSLEVDTSLTIGYGSTSAIYLGRLRREITVAVKDPTHRPGISAILHDLSNVPWPAT